MMIKTDEIVDNFVSDDTLEEAPTITEELAKEPKEQERRESIKSRRTTKHSKLTHFKALALMGEEVFGNVRKAKELRSGIPNLSPSSLTLSSPGGGGFHPP